MALSQKGKEYMAKREAQQNANRERISQSLVNQWNKKETDPNKKYVVKEGNIYLQTREVTSVTSNQRSTIPTFTELANKKEEVTQPPITKYVPQTKVESFSNLAKRKIQEEKDALDNRPITLLQQNEVSKEALNKNKPNYMGKQTNSQKQTYSNENLFIKDERGKSVSPYYNEKTKLTEYQSGFMLSNFNNERNKPSMIKEIDYEPFGEETIKWQQGNLDKYRKDESFEYGNYDFAQNPLGVQDYLNYQAKKNIDSSSWNDKIFGFSALGTSAGIEYGKWALGGKALGTTFKGGSYLLSTGKGIKATSYIGTGFKTFGNKIVSSGLPIISETGRAVQVWGKPTINFLTRIGSGSINFATSTKGLITISSSVGVYTGVKSGSSTSGLIAGVNTFAGLKGFDAGFGKVSYKNIFGESSRIIETKNIGRGYEQFETIYGVNKAGTKLRYSGLLNVKNTATGTGKINYMVQDLSGNIIKSGSGKVISSSVKTTPSITRLGETFSTSKIRSKTVSKLDTEFLPITESAKITRKKTKLTDSYFKFNDLTLKETINPKTKVISKYAQESYFTTYPSGSSKQILKKEVNLFSSTKRRGIGSTTTDYYNYYKPDVNANFPRIGKKGSLALSPNRGSSYIWDDIGNIKSSIPEPVFKSSTGNNFLIKVKSGSKSVAGLGLEKPSFFMNLNRLGSSNKLLYFVKGIGNTRFLGGSLENNKAIYTSGNNFISRPKTITGGEAKFDFTAKSVSISSSISTSNTLVNTDIYTKPYSKPKPRTTQSNIINTPPPPFIPTFGFGLKLPIPSGSGNYKFPNFSRTKKSNRDFNYTATLKGSILGIKQSNKKMRFTGIEVRGI